MNKTQIEATLQEFRNSKEEKNMNTQVLDLVTKEEDKDMEATRERIVEEAKDMGVESNNSAHVEGVEVRDDVSENISKLFDDPAGNEQSVYTESANESIPVLSNTNLPVINPSDKKAVLCVRDNFALVMMPIYCQETKVMEGCKFYLEDIATGIPQIGVGREIRMEKDKIMGADNHSVMSSVNRFIINFSDDDLKLAFERAKIFLENAKSMVGVSNSMNIIDAYREVISYAIEKASQEESAKVLEVDRKCKYNKKENIVAINDRYFKELVEEIGIGYTPVVFCKKLTMVEAHFGQKLILHNGGRYARNTVGNRRFYNFYIVEEIMGKGGVA